MPPGTTRLYDDDDDSGLVGNLDLYIFVRGFRRAYKQGGERGGAYIRGG